MCCMYISRKLLSSSVINTNYSILSFLVRYSFLKNWSTSADFISNVSLPVSIDLLEFLIHNICKCINIILTILVCICKPTFTCSKTTIETLEKGMKYLQRWQWKHQNDVKCRSSVLNILHTFFQCFCCWLWTGKG